MFSSVAWAEQDSLSVAVTRSHSVSACRLYNVENLAQFGASLIVPQILPGLLNDFAWYTPKRLGNGYIPASFPFH